MLPIAHKEVRRVVPAVRMLAYRHRHRCVTFSQYICPMPLAKNRTDFLRTAMRVLRSNNFARRIQSFPWELILPHRLIITNAKRTARLFSRRPFIFFLYFNAANRPQRSSTCSTSRSNARIPPPPSLCNFQSVYLPYAPRKKPYRFFANSHARVAQQQFRAAYSIIPVGTDTATSFNYHKRKTDGKIIFPPSVYIFLIF